MIDQRLEHEIQHGKFLIEKGAGKVWNWESPAGKVRWQRRVQMLTSHIKQDFRILELGCGTGYFTKELVKTGASVTAIDISSDLLEEAKKTIVDKNVEFIIDNAYGMKFSDNYFDSVVGSSVLHHLNMEKALPEIFRVLKPGGTMYFTEPNMINPQIALQKNIPYVKRLAGDSPDETAFIHWVLKRQLIRAGFIKISIIPFDFLHPAIPGIFIKPVSFIGSVMEKIPVFKEIAGSLYINAITGK